MIKKTILYVVYLVSKEETNNLWILLDEIQVKQKNETEVSFFS